MSVSGQRFFTRWLKGQQISKTVTAENENYRVEVMPDKRYRIYYKSTFIGPPISRNLSHHVSFFAIYEMILNQRQQTHNEAVTLHYPDVIAEHLLIHGKLPPALITCLEEKLKNARVYFTFTADRAIDDNHVLLDRNRYDKTMEWSKKLKAIQEEMANDLR